MRPGTFVIAALAAGALASCGPTAARHATQDAGEAHARVAALEAAAERWPDQARYTLDLAYDARRFTLSGSERIAFRNASAAPLPAVWLRVWANAFGSCAVHDHERVGHTDACYGAPRAEGLA